MQTLYRYRPDGLRHSKATGIASQSRDNDRVTTHHWDGSSIVMETGDNGSVKARYLRGVGLIAQQIDGSEFYYLLGAHGDVVQRVGGDGSAAPEYKYDAFGNQRDPVATDPNPFRYCGEYLDAETGEVYLRNRYYSSRTGRFGASDPARSGLNWYTYCLNNPVPFVDPLGLAALPPWVQLALEKSPGYTLSESVASRYNVNPDGSPRTYDLPYHVKALLNPKQIVTNVAIAPAISVVETKDRITINATVHVKGVDSQTAEWNAKYRALALKGIKNYWSGSYDGKQVVVNLNVIDDLKNRKKGQNYITIQLNDGIGNSSTSGISVDIKTKENSTWNKYNVGGQNLYAYNTMKDGGRGLTDVEFAQTAAHEFGHNMGLGDAYIMHDDSLVWKAWSTAKSIMNNQFKYGRAQDADYANLLTIWPEAKIGSWYKW